MQGPTTITSTTPKKIQKPPAGSAPVPSVQSHWKASMIAGITDPYPLGAITYSCLNKNRVAKSYPVLCFLCKFFPHKG